MDQLWLSKEWEDLIIGKHRGLQWVQNGSGECSLLIMTGICTSLQFLLVFHLSMKMSVSLVEIRQLNGNFLFDKQLFQAFKMPWVDILSF